MAKVKLGDVAREYKSTVKDAVDLPNVGLEHLTPGEIELTQWSEDNDNTFTKGFKKGHLLFGRRRAYLKKAAVAPFDGICSGDITVIEAIPEKILPELLPFVIQNDRLFDYAVEKSAGSLSPRVKWEHLKNYEFELPESGQQKELVDLLWAMTRAKKAYQNLLRQTDELVKSQFIEMFGGEVEYDIKPLSEVSEIMAGGDKPKDNSEIATEEYRYPVYANGVDNEGFQCFAKEYRVGKPAVTISARGTIGATFIRKPYFTPVVRLIAVIPNASVNVTYLKYAIDSIGISGTGTSQQQLTVPNIKKEAIPVPPIELQIEFEQLVEQSDISKSELTQAISRIDDMIKALL